jgi:KipI family sensor histidine kinase inhibitor
MSEYKVLIAGDTALVIEFGDRVDRRLSMFVLALSRRLDEVRIDGVIETVPTFRSLMVYYDPLTLSVAALTAHIDTLIAGLQETKHVGRRWRLPVCYDPALAADLDEVAACTGLTVDEVIERHSAVVYHLYMLGFMPGLAYLGDVPPELVLPRRKSPRPRIAAGSLAIGMAMTCVYPRESPGGLHLIGRSPVVLWHQHSPTHGGPAALLAPGDEVVFAPISLHEYEEMSVRAASGTLDVSPTSVTDGATT